MYAYWNALNLLFTLLELLQRNACVSFFAHIFNSCISHTLRTGEYLTVYKEKREQLLLIRQHALSQHDSGTFSTGTGVSGSGVSGGGEGQGEETGMARKVSMYIMCVQCV